MASILIKIQTKQLTILRPVEAHPLGRLKFISPLHTSSPADVLSLPIPISDLHIRKKLDKDKVWVLHALNRSIRQALAAGIPYVSLGFGNAGRAGLSFLEKVVRAPAMPASRKLTGDKAKNK